MDKKIGVIELKFIEDISTDFEPTEKNSTVTNVVFVMKDGINDK
ncbi:hypothetical protein WFZ85_09940 [Flavobacterium sp. j3]|jgi:hypothetical protein|uniref:Uncharacterized protein n=1 Tax=Flavobacterium aureirubrum TaxID=3133147 RepID=A0ABU9N5F5_9FLAO